MLQYGQLKNSGSISGGCIALLPSPRRPELFWGTQVLGLFPAVQPPNKESHHLLPSNVKVKNGWNHTHVPQTPS